jgi:hypothetical protein
MIVRRENLIYKIKGKAITSLSIDQNRATFNGRASIEDVTDPDFPIEIDGNATLQVKMTDNGEPGSADSLAVTIWNMTGGLWFASHWDDVETLEQTIGGGNLVVRSSRYLPKTGISGSEFSPRHPPIPLSIVLLSAPCRFLIQFPVLPEVDYAIERSRDLIVWTHLTTVMSFTNEVLFFDTPDAVGAGQYYRVRPSR